MVDHNDAGRKFHSQDFVSAFVVAPCARNHHGGRCSRVEGHQLFCGESGASGGQRVADLQGRLVNERRESGQGEIGG